MEEKELFAYTVIPEKFTYFFMKFYVFVFLFIFMFFNNWPMNNVEFIIYDFLLKDIGFYSHYYTLQSILLSNFIAFSVPVICVCIFSTSRIVYVTKAEAEELGFIIKYNFRFKMIRVIAFFISFSIFLFMFVYMFFFNFIDLEESGRNTSFFRDNIFSLFILPYLFFLTFILLFPMYLSRLSHPIIFFSSNLYANIDLLNRRTRIVSTLREHYKDQRDKK